MSGTRKVLLVDNNQLFLRHVRRFLNRIEDVVVVEATTSPSEAIDIARRDSPDVCIIDITMPEMSGIDLIPKLKELLPSTRVIVLTSHDDPSYRAAARAANADAYVLKDRIGEDLIDAIHGG
jgi:two-component system, NarL family, response regulator DegU